MQSTALWAMAVHRHGAYIPMEHELSAFYDITHGEGLAILTPAWMEHILNDDTLPMFVEFAKKCLGTFR